MPTMKPRLNVTFDRATASILGDLAKEEHMSVSSLAKELILEAGKKWGQLTGREYGLIREYMVADADRVIVGVGSLIDNVITVVNELRENGEKVGALHLRVFRPFPREELKKALAGKKVAVIDRDISIGGAAPIFVEVAEALNGTKAEVSSFYGGLGATGS